MSQKPAKNSGGADQFALIAAASLSTTRSDTLASYHRRSEVDALL